MPSNRKIRKYLSLSLMFYLILGAMLFICETVDARAGGGHDYSGGGSGGSGSGGNVGGVIAIIRLVLSLLRLCIDYPHIGIPLTIVFIAFFYYSYKTSDNYIINNTIKKCNNLYPVAASRAASSKIKHKDSSFNEDNFIKRAENAFKIVQDCWSKGDLTKAEAFLADGTYEQFLIQLNVMRERKIIDVMEDLQIKSSSILGFESNNNFDSIFLCINASAKNYRIDSTTKRFIEGDRFATEFSEVWTFIRRTGAKSLNKVGLIEGYCPNCGTPISLGRHAKCGSCGAVLRSGEHDWVLANITQACEWVSNSNESIPGVKRFMSLDRGFNVQHIEDLVSVMFWRKNEAERLGDVMPLRKIACDEYCENYKSFLQRNQQGENKFFANAAIGTIKVLAVDSDTSNTEDYIYAKVIWSGIPSKKSKNSGVINVLDNKINIKEVYVLKRKHGVKTDTKTTLSSSHCPCCGAATTSSLSNECEYCGSVLNDGTRDWTLAAVLDQNDSRVSRGIVLVRDADYSVRNGMAQSHGQNLNNGGMAAPNGIKKEYTIDDYSESMNRISGMTIVKWTAAMMLADGEIDERERKIVYEYGARKGVNSTRVDLAISEIKSQANPVDYVMQTTDLPMDNELLRLLIRVAFADGKVTKEEVEMLKIVAKKMDMDENRLKLFIAEERMNLYRMSKAVIKESRNY